jgi:hypothetical protein
MAAYIISYELRRLGANYDGLVEAIKTYGTWAKVLETVWVIKTNRTAAEVRDSLQPYMDANDGLFVVKSAGIAAWAGVNCSEWLQKNIKG